MLISSHLSINETLSHPSKPNISSKDLLRAAQQLSACRFLICSCRWVAPHLPNAPPQPKAAGECQGGGRPAVGRWAVQHLLARGGSERGVHPRCGSTAPPGTLDAPCPAFSLTQPGLRLCRHLHQVWGAHLPPVCAAKQLHKLRAHAAACASRPGPTRPPHLSTQHNTLSTSMLGGRAALRHATQELRSVPPAGQVQQGHLDG